MPKSKEMVENTDSDVSEEGTTKTTVSKKSKNKTNDDPPAKRVKANKDTEQDDVPSTIGPNGERLYEIGKLRFVSVSQFKGKSYVNIREYYDDNGVQKPGKKGISLAVDQWEKLKNLVNQVDKDLKKQ